MALFEAHLIEHNEAWECTGDEGPFLDKSDRRLAEALMHDMQNAT